MTIPSRGLTRRRVLQGAVIGGGAAALFACGPDVYDGPGIFAGRVPKVPVDLDHAAWAMGLHSRIDLGPQDLVLPQKLITSVTSVRVTALHDGTRIGFLLEWDDPDVNDMTVRVDDFRDACAVMLVAGPEDDALRTMGSAVRPSTLLHWKADWQRDVDDGRQGLDAVYPNRSIDVYPIVYDVPPADVTIESYEAVGATQWLPGVDVGNPMSAATRLTPVEKAIAYGFSTTETASIQDVTGRGERTDNGWRVVISKPLASTDRGEISVSPGTTCTCAFAVWSGSDQDGGSRKQPSTTVHTLHVAA